MRIFPQSFSRRPVLPCRAEIPRAIKIVLIAVMALVAMSTGRALAAGGQRAAMEGSIRDVSLHSQAVRKLTADHLADQVEFEIALKMRNFDDLLARTAANEQIDSKEMTRTYLPTKEQYAAVEQWARAQGLTVAQTDANHLSLFLKGNVKQVQAALHTEFVRVTTAEGDFNSASTAPSVPEELAGAILGANGLQPHLHPQKFFMKPAAVSAASASYMVSDLLSAYSAGSLGQTGSGQTIAILIDTVPSNSDLQSFWSNNGIAQSLSNITKINVRNVTLPAPSGEETLDTEWASGIAPKAKIQIYATGDLSFTSLDKGFQRIISDLATQKTIHALSISLGLGEEEISSSQLLTDSQYLATIASAGVSIFVSSGDDGSTSDGIVQPSYYASDPSVTGVGGTTLVKGSSVETGWTDSGGGVSKHFARPAWQTGTGVVSGTTRLVPDVASLANPNTGAYIFLNGVAQTVGGTSWGAPTWAGLSALINQARAAAGEKVLGEVNASIYPLLGKGAFRDITSGANGSYTCTTGYDMVTGVGSPKGSTLMQDLLASGTAGVPAIAAFVPVSGTVGTAVAITGANLGTATGVQFDGVTATFTVNSATSITAVVPAGATTGPISVTTAGAQTATSSGTFIVMAAPSPAGLAITGFSPASGYVNDAVTVSGSGFLTASAVSFSGVSANFSIVSGTQINAAVPSGAASGPLSVASASGTATSAASFTVLTSSTSASQQVLYSTAFSAAQGYSTARPLAGQNGWTSSGKGANGVLALGGGSQEAFLGYAAGFGPPNPTFVWHPVDYTPVASAPVVIFSATTTVFDSTNGASDDFGWAMYNSAGAFLFFIDFDNASGKVYYLLNGQNAAYIATGSTFTPGKPYSLVVAMDYSQNRWGATLGGQSIVTQQPISQTSQKMDFGDADAVWVYGNAFRPGNNYMVFGNYSVTASPPVQ